MTDTRRRDSSARKYDEAHSSNFLLFLFVPLVDDPAHLVQTSVEGRVREAGKRDVSRLRAFLDAHAAMPRTPLRFAIEHLDPDERRHYRSLANPKESP